MNCGIAKGRITKMSEYTYIRFNNFVVLNRYVYIQATFVHHSYCHSSAIHTDSDWVDYWWWQNQQWCHDSIWCIFAQGPALCRAVRRGSGYASGGSVSNGGVVFDRLKVGEDGDGDDGGDGGYGGDGGGIGEVSEAGEVGEGSEGGEVVEVGGGDMFGDDSDDSGGARGCDGGRGAGKEGESA
jgi:hypothetical protein